MTRAFVAIALPEAVRDALVAVQEDLPPPWCPVDEAQMHLTLAFLGDLPRPDLEEVALALDGVHAPGFDLRLTGVGVFGGAEPRVLWAGLAACPPLMALQARVAQAVRETGLALRRRRYTPHVTLARARPQPAGPETGRWIARHVALDGPGWTVTRFGLWRSTLTRHGAVHDELTDFALHPPA